MQIRVTLEEANCELVALIGDEIILRDYDLDEFDVWQRSANHSGYTIIIDGIEHKFVRVATATDIQNCLILVGEESQSEHWHEDFELEDRKRMSEENKESQTA